MDFVYVCRPGPNEELRYSIRSIIKNCNVSNVWVIGDKPDWYSGNFIKTNFTSNKYLNTVKKIELACMNDSISNDFILMNDDFFVLKEVDKIPIMYDGFLIDRINSHRDKYGFTSYTNILYKAYLKLKKQGIENPLNYDIHVPMPMNKNNLLRIINFSSAPRSYYGNFFNVGGQQYKDCKVYDKDIFKLDNTYVSCIDSSFPTILKTIGNDFSVKTKYEND